MEYIKAFDEKESKLLNNMAMGPGLYQLDQGLKTGKTVHPFAPGSYISRESQGIQPELIDIQSDLHNLTRPLTNNISLQYNPESSINPKKIYSGEGFFPQENTRSVNPAFNLKEGQSINRWEYLPINPQANAIEPFHREGVNTVLDTLDTHSKCNIKQ